MTVIAPLIERSRTRLGGIPEPAWLDPYMIGLMAMLITLLARREVDRLDGQTLALVQSEAWAEISGLKQDLIGPELMHLSSSGNQNFVSGCRAAAAFDLAFHGSSAAGVEEGNYVAAIEPEFDSGLHASAGFVSESVAALWRLYFDENVVSQTPTRIVPADERSVPRCNP